MRESGAHAMQGVGKGGAHPFNWSFEQSLNCSNSLTFFPISVPKIIKMTMMITII